MYVDPPKKNNSRLALSRNPNTITKIIGKPFKKL